ncbi:MAG: glycerate kinase [Bacteroidia bacterium]
MKIRVACDVDNPLCGPRGASTIYGPQKGASPEEVKQLDQGLENLAKVVAGYKSGNLENVREQRQPEAWVLEQWLFWMRVVSGIELVMEITRFRKAE